MRFFIKNITMSDIAYVTNTVYINTKTLVKYRDGTSELISIIFLSSEEAESISREAATCKWENTDFCGGKRSEIPGFLGEVNGFVLLADRCERYIENSVIDLIKIEINNKMMQERIKESLSHTRIPQLEVK